MSARRGKKKALVAVGHAILETVYHVLKRRVPYQELGENYFDERDRQAVKRRLVRRLESLGIKSNCSPLLKRPKEIFKAEFM